MKIIQTNGVTNINELENSGGWYWGSDYASGDLYEAEELYQDGHEVRCNRLIFLHHPDGRLAEPLKAKTGQYFGAPVFYDGQIYLLMVDFPAEKIQIFCCAKDMETVELVTELPLASVIDCYNLSLDASASLMMLRQGDGELFQIIWPERAEFPVGSREAFCFRKGDKLYFSRWEEDPDYREEVVIRSFPTGEILEVLPGCLRDFPGGQHWLLR